MGDFKDSNATTGCVANMDCDGCNSANMRKIAKKYEELINFYDSSGASLLLRHWMEGTGSPIRYDMEFLRDDNWFPDIITENWQLDNNVLRVERKQREIYLEAIKERFLRYPIGLVDKEQYLYRKDGETAGRMTGAFYTYGTYELRSRGIFKIKKINEVYKIFATIEYIWYDEYNWNPTGDEYYTGIGYTVTDDMALEYEKCGYAKSFNMYGIWHQTLVLDNIPSNKLNLDERNEITEQIKWGEIKEGKAPTDEIGTLDLWRQNNHKALTYGNRIGAEASLETMIKAGMSNTDILKQGINTDLTIYELAIFKDGTYDSSFTSSDTSIIFNGDKMIELVRVPPKSTYQNRGESHRR